MSLDHGFPGFQAAGLRRYGAVRFWAKAYTRMPLARIASASSAAGPLKVLPAPSRTNSTITREIVLAALERCGRPWRIVCASGSLSGLRAAALAGLGVTVFAGDLIPTGLAEIPSGHGLPDLGTVEFVLLGAGKTLSGPAAELADAILASGIRV